MRSNLLMNCLWYEEITPEDLADALGITPEALFQKIFQEEDFTLEEVRRISGLLALSDEEMERIFFK